MVLRSANQRKNLLPLVAEVTQSAEIALKDLSAIAVMAGPGSFTGLRIGIGVAQALAMANRTPGIVLSNLAVLALAAVEVIEGDTFFVALPAREGEFYFAVYVSDDVLGVRLLGKEQVASPDQLLSRESKRSCFTRRRLVLGGELAPARGKPALSVFPTSNQALA